MFGCGFVCWTWDAFDFFTVGLTITELSVAFDTTYEAVSWVSSLLCSERVRR